jgi:hypothetical protein
VYRMDESRRVPEFETQVLHAGPMATAIL